MSGSTTKPNPGENVKSTARDQAEHIHLPAIVVRYGPLIDGEWYHNDKNQTKDQE